MKCKLFISLFLLVLQLQVVNAQKGEVLTNKLVTDLYKAGIGSETIVSKIETSECKFDVSTNGMVSLAKLKVPDDIIKAMVKRSSDGNYSSKPTSAATAKTIAPAIQIIKANTAPDLDFINVPHYFDKTTNTLKTLERSTVAVKAKVNILKAMVPGTSTPIVFKMDSANSPVRLPTLESVSFMINTGANIPEIFGLYRMSTSKKKREAIWFNVSAFDNKSDKDVIAFNYKKVRDGVYEVIPITKLDRGEYCFVNKTSYGTYGGAKADVFAFGVD